MSYNAIAEMARSQSLRERCISAAAAEGKPDPAAWVSSRLWQLAATPGWASSWSTAVESATVNVNPDTGARTDVITDGAILSAVQAITT